MSSSSDESSGQGITDDKLPEDLRPNEDNPLAEDLDDDVDTAELDVLGGKGAEQGEQRGDQEDDGEREDGRGD